ncbi:hypothetical protein D9M68_295440 [compost metagenome]
MDIGQLLLAEHLEPLSGTLQALSQVLGGLLLGIRLQLDGVKALFTLGQQFQTRQQRRLPEQEDVRPRLGITGSQGQQRVERRIVELLGVIDQQVDLLARQRQLHDLRLEPTHIRLRAVQPLRHLAQHPAGISSPTRRDHHTLHRLLVGAGHQRLAQQGLATALRPGDHQQQLAVARQMVELAKHRLALGGEELEARHPRGERIVAELVMAEERLVGMQTGHGALDKS